MSRFRCFPFGTVSLEKGSPWRVFVTGQDLIGQLKGKTAGEKLLITEHMLKSKEPVFLDDVTVEEVEKALQSKYP